MSTDKLVPVGPAMEVEARLLRGDTAASIYRHHMQQARAADVVEPLDVTDNRCIHPIEEGRVCGKVVPKDMQQGWLCRYHSRAPMVAAEEPANGGQIMDPRANQRKPIVDRPSNDFILDESDVDKQDRGDVEDGHEQTSRGV